MTESLFTDLNGLQDRAVLPPAIAILSPVRRCGTGSSIGSEARLPTPTAPSCMLTTTGGARTL